MLIPGSSLTGTEASRSDGWIGGPTRDAIQVTAERWTSGHVLVRNTIWNLLGQLIPLAIAVVAVPILVRRLGTYRFGILTIAWMLVGYFSIFDFGLGCALTKIVAEMHGRKQIAELSRLIWTGLGLMLLAGTIGMVAALAVSPLAVYKLLIIPAELRSESLRSFYLLSFSIPIVVMTSGFRGVLAAYQRFGLINALRIPTAIFGFAGPLVVVMFTRSLVVIVAVLLLARVIVVAGYVWACLRVVPQMRFGVFPRLALTKPLLQFGGWLTLSSVISPLMMQADRFLIGGLISVAAVAYYTTPLDIVTKLLMIPMALSAAIFPAFSMIVVNDSKRTELLFRRSMNSIFVLVYPLVLLIVAFAPEILNLWLGPDFARISGPVLRVLAVGILISSFGQIAIALVQGAGRSDLSAKFHMMELPLFAVGLWIAVHWCGILGAAVAWTLRIALDTALLCASGARLVPISAGYVWRGACLLAAASVTLYFATLVQSILLRLGVVIAFGTLAGWAVWVVLFNDEDRRMLRQWRTNIPGLWTRPTVRAAST